MGGSGNRFGSSTPKQFISLGGKPLFTHALETLRQSNLFDEILLVVHPDWPITAPEKIIHGGSTRQESSYLGLLGFTQKPDIVLIHDAVRPFISTDILRNNIETALLHGAADTCIPSADTLVYAPNGLITEIPNRSHFARGQTPQTFNYDLVLQAHKQALADQISNASDDCQLLVRLDYPVPIVTGNERNIKITTEFDLQLAEHLITCKAALH